MRYHGSRACAGRGRALPIDGRRGLLVWLRLLIVFGVGGVLTGQSRSSPCSSRCPGSSSPRRPADLDERWSLFYHLVAWVVPVGGAAMYVTMGYTISRSDLAPPGRELVLLWTAAATMISFVTIFRPVSDRVVRLLFRTTASSHSVRLAGRMALIGLMLSVPGYFAFQGMLATFSDGPSDLFDQISAGGRLFGLHPARARERGLPRAPHLAPRRSRASGSAA